MKTFVHIIALISLMSGVALAGEPDKPADPPKPAKPVKKPGDKKAVEMDYGPYMAITVGVTKDNIAYKGILIPLNKEKTLNVLFDTELLRVAGVWSGGFLNWGSRNYADNNNDYCTADGKIEFATSPLPGWSHDGKRNDPRNPKDGPLPKEWGKYKGLYLWKNDVGDDVILSYKVGDTQVLENFYGNIDRKGNPTFQRTVLIDPADLPLELLVMEKSKEDKFEEQPDNTSPHAIIRSHLIDTVAKADGAPLGSKWQLCPSDDGKRELIYLKVPPHRERIHLIVALTKFGHDDDLRMSITRHANIEHMLHGGPARWTQPVTTKGTLAKDDAPYVIDTLTVPEENPYKSWMRLTGLDFFPDGRAAVCTWNGDVWIVSGIDDKLENLQWKRFATGLNNPMGVKIIDGVIHTIGRDQITKLHDLNNDGEADFYENINNDCYLTTNFHEMCFDLQTDADGNFYYTKGSSIWAGEQRMTPHNGTLIKVSKDGSKFETLCSGLRAPNGIAIGPSGEITIADNQGNWVPSCPIILVKKDGY